VLGSLSILSSYYRLGSTPADDGEPDQE
jgi:hypothetical protein